MLRFKLEYSTNCMYAHPEVETLLVARDNRSEIMKNTPDWLAEATS